MLKRLFSNSFIKFSKLIADQHNLIYLLSFVVGIASAMAAVVMKNTIYYTKLLLTEGLTPERGGYLYLAYPMVGIFFTVIFVKYIVKEHLSHGISRVLYAISRKSSFINKHNNWSSVIASTFTIGFGGSVGAEAPIVLTGASIGSNIGRHFKLNYKNITLLLGCGAAGAISGIFNAPIAGIIFTLEVLMLDLTMSSIVPLLISSVSAAVVTYFLMGNAVLFSFEVRETFLLTNLPYYLLLGLICGLSGLYFTNLNIATEKWFKGIKNRYIRLVLGGILLGGLIFVLPPLYGEGYDTIMSLLKGEPQLVASGIIFNGASGDFWGFALFLFAIILLKVFATAATNGAGGVGGVVAPSLFMGGLVGYLFSIMMNHSFGLFLPESSFTLTGMAGIFAAVLYAPLTAIFLIAEITGGYGLFIPLIVTSTTAYITIRTFRKHSIYHLQLAESGELITHNKDKATMILLDWNHEVEKDLLTVNPNGTLGDLVKQIAKSKRNIFPVVDEFNILEGVVLLDDVREKMFSPELYDKISVREVMTIPPSYIDIREKGDVVLETFTRTGAWNLPVLDEGRYVGFISKSRIYSAYREQLKQFSEE
jgi:chloride channel protein, CIC family